MNWKAGVCGGLIAGLVFGIMMGMMGMLGMVAKVVGSDSVVVGFVYHMFNSAVIGALFVPLYGRLSSNKGRGLAFGLIYGLVWWFLGPLTILPIALGMGTRLSVEGMSMALPSLRAHLLLGGILGLLDSVFGKV